MKQLGLIVNPIAGMGGAVGLKGTDGKKILEKAIALGAKPTSPAKTERFLSCLKPYERKIQLLVGAGMMGELEAQNTGFSCKVAGDAKDVTGPEDTKKAARILIAEGVDLIVFFGGDGTARDLMNAVGRNCPVLGVPTGVKMQSAVFAITPELAAQITIGFLFNKIPLMESEVMDIDEEAFREGQLSAQLYGYMLVPYEPELVQTSKVATLTTETELRNQAAIAIYVIEHVLEPDIIYVLGPGTTVRTVTDLLDEKKTLLGVDLLLNKKIISRDVNEKRILSSIHGRKARIMVTPIGGQGFIFGRGNQQISRAVIEEVGRKNIIVLATKSKLRRLKKLRVDTGDPKLDMEIQGIIKVIAGYKEIHLMKVQ